MSAFKKTIILVLFGISGWILSAGLFYGAEKLFKEYLAILLHFVFSPFIYVLISMIYFRHFNYTSPIRTAIVFILILIVLDFFILDMVLEKEMKLFGNPMSSWVPFIFIFLATFLTGLHYTDKTLGK